MATDVKILEKTSLSQGFYNLYNYRIEIPSHVFGRMEMQREVMHGPDSVVVLIYAPRIDSFVMCHEFRAGVFCNEENDDPYLYQFVAGMIDKAGKKPEEIARMEMQEEAGLIPFSLTLISSVYASPGRMTEKAYLFYAEVEGAPEAGLHGLADEGEEIVTHILPRQTVYKFMDEGKILDSMTLLALYWFRASGK